jgi:hypothetical protein
MAIKVGDLESATRGDLIVGGGAFALGFGADAFFFSDGATSTETGAACMAGALAAKYAVQEVLRRVRRKRRNSAGS